MVLCSSHAAWVWNNELLSLSLLCFLLSWHSSTLVLGLCTAVCAPPSPPAHVPFSPSCPSPLLFSSSQCGVSGWVLQCCRLICKYTHLEPNTHMLFRPLPRLAVSSCSSSLRVILHVVSSQALHRAACTKAHKPTVYQQCMACQQASVKKKKFDNLNTTFAEKTCFGTW